jgi:hypothetical protein
MSERFYISRIFVFPLNGHKRGAYLSLTFVQLHMFEHTHIHFQLAPLLNFTLYLLSFVSLVK